MSLERAVLVLAHEGVPHAPSILRRKRDSILFGATGRPAAANTVFLAAAAASASDDRKRATVSVVAAVATVQNALALFSRPPSALPSRAADNVISYDDDRIDFNDVS